MAAWPFLYVSMAHGYTVKLGALFDLSGQERVAGNAMLLGASSAVRYFNQRLIHMGYEMELVVKDTGSQEGNILLGAMELDRKRRVISLLGPANRRLVKTLIAYVEAHSIPLVVTSGREPLSPSPWNKIKWTFGITPSIGHMSRAFCRDVKRLGMDRIGILVEDEYDFQRDLTWVKAHGVEARLEIVGAESFSPGDADFVTQLEHLRNMGAKLVLYRGEDEHIPRLLSSLHEAPIAIAFLMDTSLHDLTGATRQRRYSIYVQSPLLFQKDASKKRQMPAILAFKAAMESTSLRSRQEILSAAKGWDAVGLLASAILDGAKPNRHGLLKVLSGRRIDDLEIKLRYHGLLGDFSPDKRDHCGFDTRDLRLIPLE